MADLAGETDAWSLSKRGPLKIENVDAVGHFQGRSIGFFGKLPCERDANVPTCRLQRNNFLNVLWRRGAISESWRG
jgi:hypothetical protein